MKQEQRQDRKRQRESLNRAVRQDAQVIIKRAGDVMRIGVAFNGSVLDITRIVAQAFGFQMLGTGIQRSGEASELGVIMVLANCCAHLYNVRLI